MGHGGRGFDDDDDGGLARVQEHSHEHAEATEGEREEPRVPPQVRKRRQESYRRQAQAVIERLLKEAEQARAPNGVAGAAGRESAVQMLLQRSYGAGYDAPRASFNGDIYRNIQTEHWENFLDHSYAARGGGRYNAPGEPLIYACPTRDESVDETNAYSGIADRTVVRSHYETAVDPATGRGGIAEIESGMAEHRIARSAFTQPKGKGPPPLGYRLLGEHPYSMPQQAAKGAEDAGASGIRAPSATGGTQIDIIPRNTAPSQITPLDRVDHDKGRTAGPTESASAAKSMPEDASRPAPGPIEMPAGEAGRAGSARYGAAGGGAMALIRDVGRYRRGEVSAGGVAKDAALAVGTGAASGVAFDALAPRLGGGAAGAVKAGGAVSGVLDGGFSTWNNAQAYRAGQETASQATANVVVDTTVGAGAGAAGAAAGAALGSIVPVAGTAIGAGIGFVGGMAVSYLTHAIADNTGLTSGAKRALAAALSKADPSLRVIWSHVSAGTEDVSEAASALEGDASRLWHRLTH